MSWGFPAGDNVPRTTAVLSRARRLLSLERRKQPVNLIPSSE